MKTLEDLLAERRSIENELQVWLSEWKALFEATGLEGDPFAALRPIEEIVRERM